MKIKIHNNDTSICSLAKLQVSKYDTGKGIYENVKTFPHEVFILFSIGSHLRYFSLKTEQNKVKVIGCGKRYSPIHQIKRPNLTRKIGDDVNATTPYPESNYHLIK